MNRNSKHPLIHIDQLDGAIADILHEHGDDPFSNEGRNTLVALFREALEEGRNALRQAHESGAAGQRIIKGHTFIIDVLLYRLHALLHGHWHFFDMEPEVDNTPDESYAMVATGGYGRGELAPYSDIDLLFILPTDQIELASKQVEKILYFLWDLGLDVGHAVRTLDECMDQAGEEVEIRTSMLETRFLAGNRPLFKSFRTQFDDRVLSDPAGFVKDKVEEMQRRHERFGNSLFYLEPNIKENPGGMRDLHSLVWVAKYRYKIQRLRDLIPMGLLTEEELRTFTRAQEFIWRVRNALHYHAERRDDRLTFDHQTTIAESFGYRDRDGMLGVEQFMRRYYQTAKQINNLCQIFLHQYMREDVDEHRETVPLEKCFVLEGDMLTVSCLDLFAENPVQMMRLFEVAQQHEKSIHPNALRLVSQNLGLADKHFRVNPEVTESFRNILTGPVAVAWALRKMNNCGLLGRFIPEFGRIIGQTQHDLFHVYTVDEHSILAVESLRAIRAGKLTKELPLATELISRVRNPLVLYIAVLFHDIAKGRGGNHEIKGAVISRQVCPRLGLNKHETEQVAWLVRNHLHFSHTAFRRDINDPEAVFQFARWMGSQENLDLLLLLTVSDIRAVGPNVWSEWKATLLRRLHKVTSQILSHGLLKPEDLAQLAEEQRNTTLEMLQGEFEDEQILAYTNRFYDDYFVGFEPGAVADHFRSLHQMLDQPLATCFRTNQSAQTTDMLIHTQDHPGLMARISGALAAESVSILSVNGYTAKDGMALDVFIIQDAQEQPIKNKNKQDRIRKTLNEVLSGKVFPQAVIPCQKAKIRKESHFDVPTDIEWDHNASEVYTLMEITTRNRFGLLHTVTRVLTDQGVQINTCRIATYGEKAIDVFYLKDLFGLKLGKEKCNRIAQALVKELEALEAA
uniref:Bifunctional uridylyltransferase/uridylyl-removing enzyme n=1 Tax=Magnetococcus massalia (strain MO-1) TaxID=451514 RepID=A0A1S7LF76_MAGMO|nr:[Protein-PII] uridylyltransferase [Candidatus Magnetococcus massalia]